MDGFYLIDKPKGMTSRKVSDYVGKLLHTKKVGHIGTLDPFASGLLIVAVNKGCKAIPFVDDETKVYEATLKLGEKTSSGDLDGEVIEIKDVPTLDSSKIETVLNSFLGNKSQIPPMTSAIRVNGKRLYDLAHKGIEIERLPRIIHIFDISLISYDPIKQEIKFVTKVSKGTYIRVLGEDIAKELGTVGHLTNLIRLEVGNISIDEANEMNENMKIHSVYEILSKAMDVITLDKQSIEDMKNGKIKYLTHEITRERVLVVDSSQEPIAVYIKDENNQLKFVRGLF